MGKGKHKLSGIGRRMAGILLVLLVLVSGMAGGLFAKYIISDRAKESANLARMGILEFKVLEHKVVETYEKSGIYELSADVVESNTYAEKKDGNVYGKVIPGVDIPKDPFVRLKLDADVSYELYIKVTESANFPATVTYKVRDDIWEEVEDGENEYRYKGVFQAGTSYDRKIYILKGDESEERLKDGALIVSQDYIGDGDFTLTFEATLKQTQKTPGQANP